MPRRALVQLQVINRNDLFRNNLNNNDHRYPLIYMRDHLFHAAFVKLALFYAKLFSEKGRRIIEFLILATSLLSFILLVYIHVAFVQTPTNCLANVQEKWPRDGILRVEILQEKVNGKYTLEKSYLKEQKIRELEYEDLTSYFFFSSGFYEDDVDYRQVMEPSDNNIEVYSAIASEGFISNISSYNASINELDSDNVPLPSITWSEDEYIMEFSLEYGFLKLSPAIRKQYNISVELVTLDPNVDECFGGPVSNFILYNFLGYEEVLLASLKLLASKEEFKGYVRNVVSEMEFIFVNAWMDRKSYITAGFVMMVFTVSISILLRYSHHQIFVFIVELLHMIEFHSSLNFPAGPLLTVILALVGMEAIMSEFFGDTAIAFYVILIVWIADQFDTICCKSVFTKKHWLKFFYLYHFFFYAYSYRFGHNKFLALLTSWSFTVHSMVYFFHRYELPILLAYEQHQLNNNPPGNNSGNVPPEAARSVNQQLRSETSNDSQNNQHRGEETNIPDLPNETTTTAPNNNENQSPENEFSVYSAQSFKTSISNLSVYHGNVMKDLSAVNNIPYGCTESKKYFCRANAEISKTREPSLTKRFKFNLSKAILCNLSVKSILNVVIYLIICSITLYIVINMISNPFFKMCFRKLHGCVNFKKLILRPSFIHS